MLKPKSAKTPTAEPESQAPVLRTPTTACFCSAFKEARKGFSLLYCLWNEGRLQRRMFNGVGKLYVSLQLYCWAIL